MTKIKFEWELIPPTEATYRAKVIGGWIVYHFESMVFIPDPEHNWEIDQTPK